MLSYEVWTESKRPVLCRDGSRPVLREGIAMQYKMTQPEYQRILDFKRDMHMHPELSHHEFRTTEKIKEFLSSIPSCRILPLPVETGVLANSGQRGRT